MTGRERRKRDDETKEHFHSPLPSQAAKCSFLVLAPALGVGAYSPLMLAALMIGHHFSISAFWCAREAFRRLLLARRDFLAELGEALAHRRIGQRLHAPRR